MVKEAQTLTNRCIRKDSNNKLWSIRLSKTVQGKITKVAKARVIRTVFSNRPNGIGANARARSNEGKRFFTLRRSLSDRNSPEEL